MVRKPTKTIEMIKINLSDSVIWVNKDHIILYKIIDNYEACLYLTDQKPIKLYRNKNNEFEKNQLKDK